MGVRDNYGQTRLPSSKKVTGQKEVRRPKLTKFLTADNGGGNKKINPPLLQLA